MTWPLGGRPPRAAIGLAALAGALGSGCTSVLGVDELSYVVGGSGGSGGSPVPGCFPPPSGLVSWWPGDGDARDVVGGNDGALLGPAGAVTFVPGKVGQAFHFENAGFVVAPAQGLPSGPSSRTLEAWVEFEATYGGLAQGLFAKYGVGAAEGVYPIYVTGSGPVAMMMPVPPDAFCSGEANATVCNPFPEERGAWHHVALTYDAGGTTNLFIDGAEGPQQYNGIDTPSSGALLHLGGDPDAPSGLPTEWLTGKVDEVSVYSRALGNQEILSIYDAGSAGKCR